jgi:hypothetical protein
MRSHHYDHYQASGFELIEVIGGMNALTISLFVQCKVNNPFP